MRIKLLIISLLFSIAGWSQVSYLGLDGGLEGTATIDNAATYAAPQAGKWAKANATQTIANETSVVRSGVNSLRVNNSSTTGRRVWSPNISVASTTSQVTLQYYRRVASITNSQDSQSGIINNTETLSGSYTAPASANVWEKVTYTKPSSTWTTISGLFLHRQLGTGGDMYIDDMCVYTGAADVTAPNAPTAGAVSNPSTNTLDLSWTAASGGVDGGGYLVVRGTVDPTTTPNANGIYAVGNNIAAGMTVVYQGTGTSFTDTGLTAGTTYFYRIYTYDKAYNYSSSSSCNGTTSGGATYTVTYNGNGNTGGSVPVDAGSPYSSGTLVTVLGNTGSLVNTGYTFTGWNTAANGSGSSYVAGNTFNIAANTTLYAQWLISNPPVITSSLAASGTQGTAFTYNIVATNSPTSYGATVLPGGLSINTATGAITGTPTVSGTFNVSISATNAAGTDTQTLVITLAAGPCLSDGFSGGTTPPSGWAFTAIGGTYTTAGNFGAASPALQMDATGDSVTTATVTNASELSFWIKGNGTNATSALLVEGFNGVSWVTIDNITNSIPIVGTTKTYNASTTPALIDGFIQFRFVYTKGTGNLAFDDVKVSCVTVWDGSAWSNGTPTLTSVAVINGNYDTTSHGDIQAYNLTVNPTFTVAVTSNHFATIQNNLTVNGTLNIQNNGSLVQINDSGVNTGNINMERTAIADRLDYVYWSTPVNPFSAADISLTSDNSKLYKWIPTVPTNVNGHGTWASGNETMVLGQGYIERGLNNSATDVPFTATFTGVPNNGVINIPISRGTYDSAATYDTTMSTTYATKDDDNWNLLGNPYPSSISLYEFLTTNTNIGGFVKIWKHGLAPSTSNPSPFYNTYGYNYDAADYTTYNLSGSSAGSASDFFIGAGQGFIVLMNANTAADTENVTFKNVMRNKNYRNDLFFKSGSSTRNAAQEQGRIWLDIVSSTTNRRTMVGYINGATNENDRLFDAITNLKTDMTIYSLIGFEGQVVQGRALPFNQNDQVPLGIKVPTNGTYNIAIGEVDGFFANSSQNIYLEDKALNVIHDLRTAPYQFTEVAGIKNDRFVLRYTNQTLGSDQFEVSDNSVKIYASDNSIVINSLVEPIKAYEIYNVLGQTLANKKQVKVSKTEETSLQKNNQTLIVKVTLENGKSFTKKVIY